MPPTFVPGFHDEQVVKCIPFKKFGKTEMMVSAISFGSACIANGVPFKDDNETPVEGTEQLNAAFDLIESAVKSGINYFDTAPFYGAGKSEIVLGLALKRLPRQSFYIATKVGRNEKCCFDYSAKETRRLVENSLRKLNVEYLDVIQVHDVEFVDDLKVILEETLPELEKLKREGKVKFIGITGYPLEPLKEVVEKTTVVIDSVLSYCRRTLFDNRLEQFLPFFRQKNLAVINAAVHGMGLLTPVDIPPWHVANIEVKEACEKAKAYCEENEFDISKIALGAALMDQEVDTVLVGMRTKEILDANLKVLKEGLTEKEKKGLKRIMEDFFEDIVVGHWEGVELYNYWKDSNAFCEKLRKHWLSA